MQKSKIMPGLTVTPEQLRETMGRVKEAHRQRQQDYTWVSGFFPHVIPSGWTIHQQDPEYGMIATHYAGLRVIMGGAREDDGLRWLHVSCSRHRRLPNWDDLKLTKEIFLGPDRWAVQVLPTADKYVNINPFVLHIWHCVDEVKIPDFTWGTGSI